MAQTRRSTYLIAGSIEQYFEEAGETYLAGSVTDPDDVMTPLQAAAANYRIAQGPRAGQKVLSLQLAPRRPGRSGESSALCANAHGFSLRMRGSPISHIQILNRNEWFKSIRNSIFRP